MLQRQRCKSTGIDIALKEPDSQVVELELDEPGEGRKPWLAISRILFSKREAAMNTDIRARVKAINDLYRSALMNKKYYEGRLSSYQRSNKMFEILLAVGTSTAVAGWGVWKVTNVGAVVWAALAGAAALAAVIKPILQLGREVERYSKLHFGYCSLFYDLDAMTFELRHSQVLPETAWSAFLQIRKRNNDLGLHDELKPKRTLLKKCQAEVLIEIPAGSLWLPKKTESELIAANK